MKNDLIAKLLSTENIEVRREAVHTASFNVVTRVLTLPNWVDISQEFEDMLVCHEIGHALFTPEELLEECKDVLSLFEIVNVIEDARVEKLVKRLYPGSKTTFRLGYQYVKESNFFGIDFTNSKELSSLSLLDRINLYFKVGHDCGVTFTEKEQVIVERIENIETDREVISLALELHEKPLNKEDPDEERPNGSTSTGVIGTAPDDADDGDQPDSKDSSTPVAIILTQRNLYKNLSSRADVSKTYLTQDIIDYNESDFIIPYKKVIEETSLFMKERPNKNINETTKNTVSYLRKQFDLKKAARSYRRTKTSKSGQLDSRKLYSYKVNDDLFKKLEIKNDEKNHGMLFLLDWSGSMEPIMEKTLDQLITLCSFCRSINSKFRVFAFTSRYAGEDSMMSSNGFLIKDYSFSLTNNFNLLEFLSSDMSDREFNIMCSRIRYRYLRINASSDDNLPADIKEIKSKYNLGNTPLNESLYFMLGYVNKFYKKTAVEKMTLFLLTDGECLPMCNFRNIDSSKRVVNIINDPITKKQYKLDTELSYSRKYSNRFSEQSTKQTKVFIDILKDRYPIKVVSIRLFPSIDKLRKSRYYREIMHSLSGLVDDCMNKNLVQKIYQEMKTNVYYELEGTNRDLMLFIEGGFSGSDSENEINVEWNSTSTRIAKVLSKNLSNNRRSRLFLDRYIETIA